MGFSVLKATRDMLKDIKEKLTFSADINCTIYYRAYDYELHIVVKASVNGRDEFAPLILGGDYFLNENDDQKVIDDFCDKLNSVME